MTVKEAACRAGAGGSDEPNVSKFRATKPGIEDADVHVRLRTSPIDCTQVPVLYRGL